MPETPLARTIADARRSLAADLRQKADGLIQRAEKIEQAHGIPAPCHLCGAREGCGH